MLAVDAERLDDEFEARGWSDGLPVVAPTRARVDAMLAATDYPPAHEFGTMPPRQGVVTTEILAVNAVMAGCRPAYFPVVLAAVQALLDQAFNLFAVQATTHPCAPCLIVNGPLATQLGINARYGAFGPGVRANATIGRALRLILMNVGGACPGVLDRSTQGQPAKYAYCVAENEAESPWLPLHVERGFAPEVSTVTVTAAEGPHNLNDHVSTRATGILATLEGAMADMGANNSYLYGQPTIASVPSTRRLAADGIPRTASARSCSNGYACHVCCGLKAAWPGCSRTVSARRTRADRQDTGGSRDRGGRRFRSPFLLAADFRRYHAHRDRAITRADGAPL